MKGQTNANAEYQEFLHNAQKEQRKATQSLNKEYQQYIKKSNKEYSDYLKKCDKEWAEYLRKSWTEYTLFTGVKPNIKPKPTKPPIAPKNPTIPDSDIGAGKPKVAPIDDTPKPEMLPFRPILLPAGDNTDSKSAVFDFFGVPCTIGYDKKIGECGIKAVNETGVSDFWTQMSATDYSPLITRLIEAKKRMKINDYGFYLLVNSFAKSVYSQDENTVRLTIWFLLLHSSLEARVAINNNQIILFLNVQQTVYNIRSLIVGEKSFYEFPNVNGDACFTYTNNYTIKTNPLDLDFSDNTSLGNHLNQRALRFKYNNQSYDLNLDYNQDVINFYKNYPSTELSIYFNAPKSLAFKNSIIKVLRPYVVSMDERNAVEFLLNFVQTAFEYETDDQQFQKEKFFFAEESLYYPYNDCEDRAVLFTYLVKEIIGLKVVGLHYEGHVAAAVCFNTPISGDFIDYNGQKYIISDPTYINASVGMCMPQYKNATPKIIPINSK